MSDAFAAAALRLDRVARTYKEGEGQLEVFRNVNAVLMPGELVALVGPSGAGKSSLLHMAGLLEAPTSGEIVVGGAAVSSLSDLERTRIRRDTIGFVYQAHYLLPEFSALENIVIPQLIAGKPRKAAEAEALRLLTLMGLQDRKTHRPSQLSGGEQQRVAIARAIAKRPDVLLCDEPTGALDYETGKVVLEVIARINQELGTTAVVITHNAAIA
ncbi:MAG: ABC transporter ATP-binding protein, partial [Alphaproteobacteria bacterium]|nr:ABC transporter ATP-binding protein [Alphaproteobacteria bacterium]